jgi:hypothetical protein
MNYTGTTIRDAEAGANEWARRMMRR